MLNSRPTLWLAAVAAASVGTYLLYDATPGINWGIWVAAAALGLTASRSAARKTVRTHTLLFLAWATIIAFAQAVTAVPYHSPLIVATVAILLGLAVTTLDDTADTITLPSVGQVPFSALGRVLPQTGREFLALPANMRGIVKSPVLRGLIIALPIVLILIALLAKADPILDSLRSALLGWMDNWVVDERIILFGFLLFITVGAYGLAAGTRQQLSPPMPGSPLQTHLGAPETRIVLIAVNAVLWIFVLLQIVGLARNPAATSGTGITYAEYARRGFSELSVAAAIVLGVILFLEVFRAPASTAARRNLELVAIVAVELILVSAFRRVVLYENAYGYTTERVIAQIFMLVLACAFGLLAWDLRGGSISTSFGRRGMMLTLAAFTAFTYWNYQDWIVRENFARASGGAELDLDYLAKLSPAAIPALVESRARLTGATRTVLDKKLRCKKIEPATEWYEWNVQREKARVALSQAGLKCGN